MTAKESSKRKGNTGNGPRKKQKDEESGAKSNSALKREQKQARQSHRRHSEAVTEAKVLWNKLRMKSNTTEETKELMDRVMNLIRGKVNEIALQHDASRVVQAAVQFGSEEQRKELLTEICQSPGALAELSKIQYAHFLSLKLIKYCPRDSACAKLIVKSFKGSIPKLAVHAVGARVVESLFLNLPSKETASLKQEFYGPHFSLFSRDTTGNPTLKSNLESATTENQKEAAISFVKDIITKGISKSFFGYTFFQELFAEYVDAVDPSEIRDMASNVADHSVHLLSTRAGTRVVAAVASYGTPKDRKRICKSVKGYTGSSLQHRDAYLALIRLIQVTDDTVSIHKSVLNEILSVPKDGESDSEPLFLDLALSDTASKLFLFLLSRDEVTKTKYFDPYELSVLEPVPMIKGVCTYKKEPEVRRQELLKHMRQEFIDLCINHADSLLMSLPGSRVLKEVYSSFVSKEIVESIISVCESSLDESKEDGDENASEKLSLFEDPTGHWAIKHLILCDAASDEASAQPIFSETFFERLGERLMDVASSNRGAFVVAALFKVSSIRPLVLKKLQLQQKVLRKLAKQEGANAGFKALLKEIS